MRTWAPKGQTPVVQFHFNWKQLSIIAGLTLHSCCFRLFPGTIKSEQIVIFLKALRRQLRQRLLIIWDGLRAHRSRLVRDYVDSTRGRLQLAFLPPYAPELNPQEHVWDELREKEFPNRVYADMASVRAQLEAGLPRLAADHKSLRSLTAWPWINTLILNAH